MQIRLKHTHLGALAAILLFGAPAAQAFTLGGEAANGTNSGYEVPKFDLEEQAKNFRKDGSGATMNSNGVYETPFAGGKLQFGVQPGGTSNFGSVFSPQLGPGLSAQNSRQEFDRRLAPPTSLEYYGVR